MVLSIQMPRLENKGINPYTAPGVVPALMGSIITILSFVLFVRSIVRGGFSIDFAAGVGGFAKNTMVHRVLLTVALGVVYAKVLVGNVSYVAATFAFILVFILIFEYDRGRPVGAQLRTLLTAALQAAITTAVVAAVFQYLFLVMLP